jgi:hypothetical protein
MWSSDDFLVTSNYLLAGLVEDKGGQNAIKEA